MTCHIPPYILLLYPLFFLPALITPLSCTKRAKILELHNPSSQTPLSISQIARRTHTCRETVRRVLRRVRETVPGPEHPTSSSIIPVGQGSLTQVTPSSVLHSPHALGCPPLKMTLPFSHPVLPNHMLFFQSNLPPAYLPPLKGRLVL